MDEAITIKYGAEPAYRRWFRDQWTKSDRELAPWIALFLLALALYYGPRTILYLVSFLPISELGNSGASMRAHMIILSIAFAIVGCVLWAWLRKLRRPAAITFNSTGIKKIWRVIFFDIDGKVLPWSEITSITVQRPELATDLQNYMLCFSGTSPARNLRLSIGQINDQRSDDFRRENVFKAIVRFAHTAQVEPEVANVLAPKRSLDFTELWLNALAAPPGRERLLPVEDGTVLDTRYKVQKRLGAGGQGTVYLAHDSQIADEKVVLKETILPVYADLIVRKQALANFHKEALALESLNHERIVKFKRSFVGDHRAYLVLQFIDGTTLSQKIKNSGALTEDNAIKYAIEIADILEKLHQNSPPLVHRDLTPDNLMIDANGNIILIDFAVAVNTKTEENSGENEPSSDVAGKAAYMAPEQFQGKAVTQSDLYSLGGVLFFMLTGAHPEPLASNAPLLHNSAVSEELNKLVMKATAYSIKDRFANAGELKQSLLQIK